jgi:hypothetical protein
VLDSGDGITHAVPVYEGYAIPHATVRADYGGRDITNHLQLLLRKSGHAFHTTAENEVVREIKEAKCYVTYDPDKEEALEMEQGKTFAMHQLPDGTNIPIGCVGLCWAGAGGWLVGHHGQFMVQSGKGGTGCSFVPRTCRVCGPTWLAVCARKRLR